jgi:hypothetical protein
MVGVTSMHAKLQHCLMAPFTGLHSTAATGATGAAAAAAHDPWSRHHTITISGAVTHLLLLLLVIINCLLLIFLLVLFLHTPEDEENLLVFWATL